MRRKHGRSRTPEYEVWCGIKKRCHDPAYREFHLYGGRGITMADEWRNSFERFFADMGCRPTPRHSIDRINNDGNYAPGNCHWATPAQQVRNRRVTKLSNEKAAEIRLLRSKGMTYRALAELFGVSDGSIGPILKGKMWRPINADGSYADESPTNRGVAIWRLL